MKRKNLKNEIIKREFISYLKEVKGAKEATIDSYLRAINKYEEVTDFLDFSKYTKHSAMKYKEKIRSLERRGEPVSILTIRTYLIHTFKFFKWLSFQTGYRNKINSNDINYLKPSNLEEIQAFSPRKTRYPDLEYVKRLCESIKIGNDIDQRDRALIAFIFVVPIRIDAAISLPLECIDEEKMIVHQDPRKGVRTKYSKYIISPIFPFNEILVENIKAWLKHLKQKGFSDTEPLFPLGEKEFESDILAYKKQSEVSKEYWASSTPVRIMLKKRSKAAGLPYYSPHQFRDGTLKHALAYVEDGIQMKAVSQSFGHEHITTSMMNYGNLDETELVKTVEGMNFKSHPISNTEILNELRKMFFEKINK